MSRAGYLLKLQRIDSQRDRHRKRLSEIILLLEDNKSVQESLSRLAPIKAAAESARRAHNLIRDEFEAFEHKRKAREARLYGGTVKNPKELQDLNDEVASLVRRLSTLEHQQLEAMLVQDDAEALEERANRDHSKIESEWHMTRHDLSDEKLEHEREIAQLDFERETALESVLSEDLPIYEKLRAGKKGMAVVLLENGVCGGCGMAPSLSRAQKVRTGLDLVRCGNCSRIMSLD